MALYYRGLEYQAGFVRGQAEVGVCDGYHIDDLRLGDAEDFLNYFVAPDELEEHPGWAAFLSADNQGEPLPDDLAEWILDHHEQELVDNV